MAKWLKLYAIYKHFPPNLTHVTTLQVRLGENIYTLPSTY